MAAKNFRMHQTHTIPTILTWMCFVIIGCDLLILPVY